MATTPTLTERILLYLSNRLAANPGGTKLQDIVTGVHEVRAVVNKELYTLKQQGKIEHVSNTPPLWRFITPCSASAATAAQRAPLPPTVVTTCQSESAATSEIVVSQSLIAAEAAGTVATVLDVGSGVLSAACNVPNHLSDLPGTSHRNGDAPVPVSVDSLCLPTAQLSLMPAQAASSKTVMIGDDDKVIETKILEFLTKASRSPVKKTQITQDLGITSKDANRVLHKLLREGMVSKSDETPPLWQLVKDPSFIKDSGDKLKKSTNNTLSVQALATLNDSHGKVGMICSPSTQGTGFRVGARYLMTAAHVLEDIAGDNSPTSPLATSTPAAGENSGATISATAAPTSDHEIGAHGDGVTAGIKINAEKLCHSSVYVTFSYEKASVNSPRYHFDGWFWLHTELDVALLRLKDFSEDGTCPLPGDLNALLDWKTRPARKAAVIIMGHQDNKAKEIDTNGKAYNPDFSKLDEQLYQEARKQQGNLIFYRTKLMHGSSGAPIFVSAGESIKLIGINLKSFPSAEAIYEQQKRGKRERPFQGGVRLDVMRKAFLTLYDETFFKEVFGSGDAS